MTNLMTDEDEAPAGSRHLAAGAAGANVYLGVGIHFKPNGVRSSDHSLVAIPADQDRASR